MINQQDFSTDETIDFYPPICGKYTLPITSYGGTTGPLRKHLSR